MKIVQMLTDKHSYCIELYKKPGNENCIENTCTSRLVRKS